VLNKIRERYNG